MKKRKENPTYVAIIPSGVRYNEKLRPNEKLLYGEITALSSKTGECWASNKYFADLFGVSKETVSTWVSHLAKLGYITTEMIYKKDTKEIEKRIIIPTMFLVDRYLEKNGEGYLEKIIDPIKKNIKENNTSNNNTSINNTTTTVEEENKLFEIIEKNFGRTLSPIENEEIMEWEDTELTRYAIKKAVLRGKFNIRYISKILYEWEKANIKTVQQAQQSEEEYQKSKKQSRQFIHYETRHEREQRELEEWLNETEEEGEEIVDK